MIGRRILALTALGTLTCAPVPPPTNVVLVVVDTLRADRLGAWGLPRGATPNLDSLARRAVSFPRAYAAATWTLPSIGSIVTGLHPTTLATTKFRSRIPEGVETLAERLRGEGYRTAAVVSHLLVAARAGFDQGFDEFDEEEIGGSKYVSSPGVTSRGEDLLRNLAKEKKPFFLFLHYFDPHYAFLRHPEFGWSTERAGRLDGEERHADVVGLDPPPTREEIDFLLNRYEEEVRFTDAAVGRVLRLLETLDLDRETIVVLTADHGEEFWDHGRFGHGGTQSMHEEVVRAPLIVRAPGRPTAIVNDVVSLVSVTPTILDLLGLPADDAFQAPSLLERADDPVLSEFVFTGRSQRRDSDRGLLRTWIGPRWKLVADEERGETALFDLEVDPGERRDLAPETPDRVTELVGAMRARVEELERAAYHPESHEVNRRQREQLEALGYVGN
jgi:arylsulfatase A-like enzyme